MLSKIFNIVLESNTFNFLVFIGLLWLICRKIKIDNFISGLQKKIEDEVNNSKMIKKDSQATLNKAENKIENIENDVDEIIKKSKKTAKTIAENIVKSSKSQIDIIENNAQKAHTNDIYKAKRNLNEFAVKESIKITKADIKKRLSENNSLHQKYIDEALNELEGINI